MTEAETSDSYKLIESALPFLMALNEAEVDYCLVGGLAVAIHVYLSGSNNLRGTSDVDLLVANNTDAKRLIDYYIQTYRKETISTIKDSSELDISIYPDENINVRAEDLLGEGVDAPDIDICKKLNALTFDDMSPAVVTVNGVSFPLASLDNLIEMKTRTIKLYGNVDIIDSSRPQDYIDLKTLTDLALSEAKSSNTKQKKNLARNPLQKIKQLFTTTETKNHDTKPKNHR